MGAQYEVAITGLGVFGPAGPEKEDFWHILLSGRSLTGRLTRFDSTGFPCEIAAEIPDSFYLPLVPANKRRTTNRVTQYAVIAAELALEDAKVSKSKIPADSLGVSLGTSLGGWHEAFQQAIVLTEKGAQRVNPFLAGGAANHIPAVAVARAANARGAHATFSTGCCASMHALGHAAELVARGELDYCLAGGTEAPITPLVLAAMCRSGELSTLNDHPELASRPFDITHNGLVLSEGSAMIFMERLDRARERGAHIYAQVLAHTSSADALDPFDVDPSGEAAARALNLCLARSGIHPADLDYVCANANSLPSLDRKEASTIREALGEFAAKVPTSSIKGAIGHPFGAAASFQLATVCLAMRDGVIPPTANLKEVDPLCNINLVIGETQIANIRHALVCNHGFGGLNAYIALRNPSLVTLPDS